ncbi:unnamed protein product [Lactuca virosa]|uniref:Uncharacterized protein n=1 Tax=Lactuca virosa TaxID=75947 RepID=A0AAU9NBX2_9ASTR|nr:unnamed protein product [Lactuca virosa]
MIDYLSEVKKIFCDNYEDDKLIINGSNDSILAQDLRILDLAETKGKDIANSEIYSSKELKQLFHFDETINSIEESSEKETYVYISEEEVDYHCFDIKTNFMMNKVEPQFDHHYPGESSFQGERRKRPKTGQGNRSTFIPDLPIGNPN